MLIICIFFLIWFANGECGGALDMNNQENMQNARHGLEQRLEAERKDYWQRLGALPAPGPLNLKAISSEDKEEYEKILVEYDAFAGEKVKAYLLLPAGYKFPLPAVLCVHGHGGNFDSGKERATGDVEFKGDHDAGFIYGVELAKRGYVVIAPDQLTFGERHDPRFKGKAQEVFEEFNRFAEGSSLAAKNSFDISRAVDVLCSLPEVDKNRIGIMGHSGGGAQTLAGCCYDPRIKIGVSNCGFGDHKYRIMAGQVENISWAVPGQLPAGDMGEQLALVAPRPFLMINAEGDGLFPMKGVLATYQKAKEVYETLGVGDRLALHIEPGIHQFTAAMRETGYRFLGHWLKDNPLPEMEITYSTPRQAIPPPAGILSRQRFQEMMRCKYIQEVPAFGKALESKDEKDLRIDKVQILVEKDPGIEPWPHIPAYILRPGEIKGKLPVVILLHREVSPFETAKSEVAGMAGDPQFALGPELARQGFLVLCPDLAGFEERQHPKIIATHGASASYRQRTPAAAYLVAGASLAARSCFDLAKCLEYISTRADADTNQIAVVGIGRGGQDGCFFAAVDERIKAACAIGGLTTLQAEKKLLHLSNFALYVPGLATLGDTPAAFSLIAPRPFLLYAFTDSDCPSGTEEVAKALKAEYAKNACPANFTLQIVSGKTAISPAMRQELMAWLRNNLKENSRGNK